MSANTNIDRLGHALDGSRVVKYDPQQAVFLAWKGGESTGIHVYDPWGQEVSYWQLDAGPSASSTHPTIGMVSAEDVEISMAEHMAQSYYPN